MYRNKSINGQVAFENVADPLYSIGFSGKINLYVASADIPAMQDIDQDGDLDILVFESAGHYIECHRNFSMETTGKPGLDFRKDEKPFLNFLVNDCRDLVFLSSGTADMATNQVNAISKVNHIGNSLAVRVDQGKLRVLFGHVTCPNLVQLGEGQLVQYDFPASNPVALGAFAAPYVLDLEGDGLNEILVSTNTYDNNGYVQDFQRSVYLIKNDIIQTTSFLQDQMIDVGEKASPCLWDMDGDGDLDLLIGNGGIRGSQGVRASIFLYENIQGVFTFKTADYLDFSGQNQVSNVILSRKGADVLLSCQSALGPKQFILSRAGIESFPLADLGAGEIPVFDQSELYVLGRNGRIRTKNQADWGNLANQPWQTQSFSFADVTGDGIQEWIGLDRDGYMHVGNYQVLTNTLVFLPIDLPNQGQNTNLSVADLHGDGKPDLLIGMGGGGIHLFRNQSKSPVWENNSNSILQVWPNPVETSCYAMSNEPGELEIVDLQGKQIQANLIMQLGEIIRVNPAKQQTLFFRFRSVNGQFATQKVLIP